MADDRWIAALRLVGFGVFLFLVVLQSFFLALNHIDPTPFVAVVTFVALAIWVLIASRQRGPRVPAPAPALAELSGLLTSGTVTPSWVEGRLRGERVSVRASSPTPTELWCVVARVQASVPLAAAATFVRGPGGPCLAGFRPLPEPYAESEELRVILGFFDEVEVSERGVEARARDEVSGRGIVAAVEALIAFVGRVRTDTPGAEVAPARPGPRCPFCRDEVDAWTEDAVACAGCATLHHTECWAENRGRCTVRGCEGKQGARVPDL